MLTMSLGAASLGKKPTTVTESGLSKGWSIDDVMSRRSIAERIFERRRREQGLAAGITLQECLNDDGIEYLQERLLAGDESRFDLRSPVTVNSIVRTVMTFAGFCAGRKRKWIDAFPRREIAPMEA